MQLCISEDDVISNIQSDFHECYPWLKLEFYKNPHEQHVGSPKEERWDPSTPIDEIRMFHSFGLISIDHKRKVAELEHEFFVRFGLCVQVHHRSGNLWLATTVTDSMDLLSLNEKAKDSIASPPCEEAMDYNLEDVG